MTEKNQREPLPYLVLLELREQSIPLRSSVLHQDLRVLFYDLRQKFTCTECITY